MADPITQHISRELYWYMCQHIVGTEGHVKKIRLMNAVRDNLSMYMDKVDITSGSFGEGLSMRGSDLDIMTITTNIKVFDVKPQLEPILSYLIMDRDDVKPGFTQLRIKRTLATSMFLENNYVQFNNNHYLSSTLWQNQFMPTDGNFICHGPCISDKQDLYDIAECLHCKSWIAPAGDWIKRSNYSWPSSDVKQSVIKHGVLFVPIGVKGSPKEDLEWRISFSVGEKLLMNTFTHTQLLCYALMKILLKDVIATYSECKDLLCSYFIKTIIFWISEELPHSAWRPDKLIPCFMQCFSRLIYCVEYSVCLHYFIPENNMFENKIEGHAREILLEKLHTLHRYGWRCILFSDQVSTFSTSMQYFNMEQNSLYINDVEKTTSSPLLHLANDSLLAYVGELHSFSVNGEIQKTLSYDKSSTKYLYVYYMSMICSVKAQSIHINIANSKNKDQYRKHKSCICTLLKNIYHDAVSGWLMLASYFYKTKQYTTCLHIIMDSVSKCTFEKLYPLMEVLDIHHRLFKLKSLQKKSTVHLWKYILVENIRFEVKSQLIPDELRIEVDNELLWIPSSVYACFLCFLCHYHLNDAMQCWDTLQVLQRVTECNHLFKDICSKASAYNILGVALQTVGNIVSARKAFLQSYYINPYDNNAKRRLIYLIIRTLLA